MRTKQRRLSVNTSYLAKEAAGTIGLVNTELVILAMIILMAVQ